MTQTIESAVGGLTVKIENKDKITVSQNEARAVGGFHTRAFYFPMRDCFTYENCNPSRDEDTVSQEAEIRRAFKTWLDEHNPDIDAIDKEYHRKQIEEFKQELQEEIEDLQRQLDALG